MVGSRYYKGDLHVHSPNSADYNRKEKDTVTAEMIISEAKEKGLDFIAITDHNSITHLSQFIDVARELDFIIFPGVELYVKEGFHVLAIFDNNIKEKYGENVLTELCVHFELTKGKEGDIEATFNGGLRKLRELVDEYDGILIAAHIHDERRGFLSCCVGQGGREIFIDAEFDAMENAESDSISKFNGKDPNFPCSSMKACIKSSDSHKLTDIGSKYTLYKMETVSFRELKNTLRDPYVRILREKTPPEYPHFWIEEIKVDSLDSETKGFLDGIQINFHPNLNCLIGGRGAGKSMILEAIGYALDVQQYPKYRKKKEYNELIEYALGKKGRVTLTVNYNSEKYIIERVYSSISTIRDGSDVLLQKTPQEMFLYTFYSQNQITDITKNQVSYKTLIEALDNNHPIPILEKQIHEKILILKQDRVQMKEFSEELERLLLTKNQYEETKSKLERTSQQIEEYDGVQAHLSRYKIYIGQIETALASYTASVISVMDNNTKLNHKLNQLIEHVTKKNITEKSENVINNFVSALLPNMNGFFIELANHLQKLIYCEYDNQEVLDIIIQEFDNQTHSIYQQLPEEDQTILRECTGLQILLKETKEDYERYLTIETELKDLRDKRKEILDETNSLKNEVSFHRDELIESINKKLKKRVSISQQKGGNREPFSSFLHEVMKEKYRGQVIYYERIANHMDIETFLDQLDNDTLPEIVKNNEVSETLWLRLKDHFSNEYARMELQEIICDDLTDMHLMVGTSRKRMRSITKCSHGQRNTAVLDILLSLPELGLIIDQPEDELDNAYLYNHLITSLRKIKNKRQIIAPTHNPNIPVSGDAENVICLQNNDEILEITHQGSIDNIGIIEQVQNNMEGGKEAFERRIWKYGYRIADIQ